ncbi:flagellar hook-basal body protein [Liquorilactobacillus uvarum]|uniref:Flagellar basal-body rod protein n=2 Tax=Liquorilactobacillus uvarum TaxID=303240 RepID=A0A0R1PYG4_9LACO|nr:flagellar hook-basal body protein [Liquorilactobacillus uvarum]AJA34416.1 flagellar basal-body rod protein FlgG [Liquorilactobacillus uvarum DSM 19971]KRL37584.1 flagellar basal-body rod protein [Liquorilactobacillus uvarum DSM 19971]
MNMNSLLSINKSGLNGLQKSMDVVSNNIANVNTVGYKSRDTSFQELLNNQTTAQEVSLSPQATNTALNEGLEVNQENINFAQGSLQNTDSPYDMAIEGQGFFGVYDQNNNLLLTRDGDFHRNGNGELVNQQGYRLSIDSSVPQNSWPKGNVRIDSNGSVNVQDGERTVQVGRIPLYSPNNTNDLQSIGNNLYRVANGAQLNTAFNGGLGSIQQYHLENSTVDLSDSMSNMIITQRAYGLNAKAVQATDDMLSVVNKFSE